MTRSAPLAFLATLVLCGAAQAAPIAFTQATLSTFAAADAGDARDGPAEALGDAGPLTSSAQAVHADGDAASAVAFAEQLFLATTAEASGRTGVASASAVSTFSGLFDARPGQLALAFDFDRFLDTLTNGSASGTLAVTLTVDARTLFDAVLTESGGYSETFALHSGGAGRLDLTLIGTTFADPGSYAFGLASVDATLDATPFAVPEPPGAGLLLAAGAGFVFVRRRARPRALRQPSRSGCR